MQRIHTEKQSIQINTTMLILCHFFGQVKVQKGGFIFKEICLIQAFL